MFSGVAVALACAMAGDPAARLLALPGRLWQSLWTRTVAKPLAASESDDDRTGPGPGDPGAGGAEAAPTVKVRRSLRVGFQPDIRLAGS